MKDLCDRTRALIWQDREERLSQRNMDRIRALSKKANTEQDARLVIDLLVMEMQRPLLAFRAQILAMPTKRPYSHGTTDQGAPTVPGV